MVLTDTGGGGRLAEMIAESGRSNGAEVILLSFTQIKSVSEIPPRVHQPMVASDIVIPLCKSRILYSSAVTETLKHSRILYMADVPTELFLRPIVRKKL